MSSYIHKHTDTQHTSRLVQTPRLKASGILDMGVYYMAGMQGARMDRCFFSVQS